MKKIKFFFSLVLITLIAACGKDDNNDDSNKLDAPELLTPTNNYVISYDFIHFDWSNVANATEYFIEVSSTSDFSNIVYSLTTNQSEDEDYFENLTQSNVTYYWHVKALAAGYETSDFSSTFTFVLEPTGNNSNFNLLTPANNSSNIALNTTFTCESVTDATLYKFYFYINGNTSFPSFYETSVSPQITTSQLQYNQIYSWRVVADLTNGFTQSTTYWSFQTDAGSSNAPILVSPANGSSVTTTTPTFTWQGVAGASSYTGELSLDNTFSTYYPQTVSGTSFTIPSNTPLASGSTYFWRVKANNSGYSTIFTFTVNC